eukprot:5189150-Prymnesium_polylepis.1
MGWVMHITVRGRRVVCRARGGRSGREAPTGAAARNDHNHSDAQPSLNYQACREEGGPPPKGAGAATL